MRVGFILEEELDFCYFKQAFGKINAFESPEGSCLLIVGFTCENLELVVVLYLFIRL